MADRLWCFIAAAVLMASPAVAQQAPASSPSVGGPAGNGVAAAYYQFLLGRHYESDGDVDRAITAHRAAEKLDPASAEIRAELAALFARQSRLNDAGVEARAALAIDPLNREANRVLGSIAAASLEDGRRGTSPAVEEAIGYLERARRGGLDEDASLDITLARLYTRAGQNDKAIGVLTSLVQREPIGEAYLLLAEAHQAAGHPDLAARALEAGADDNPRLLASLGELYERQQQWDKAADAYGRAVALTPHLTDLKMRWASALLNQPGDESSMRAQGVLKDVVATQPTNDRAFYLLAQAQRRSHDYDAAEASAKRVVALDPKGLWGPFALAQVYEDQRLYKQVVETLKPAVADWQPSGDMPARQGLIVLTHLGFAQMQLGQHTDAIATFERARALSPSDSTYDLYLTQAYLGARQYDDALKVVGPLRARRPSDPRVAQLQARVLAAAGKRDQAVAVLRDTVKNNPDVTAAYLSLADVLAEASRTDEALKVLEDASARFPDDVSVPFQRGALYERAKDYDRAERSFRDVLARDPLHAPALNYLGYMFADRGEHLDEAVDLIERALKIDPGNGSYLDSLGWAYFKQKKLDRAEQALAGAADQLPANSVVQDHFGDVLSARGKPREAVQAWERALAGDMESLDRSVVERKIRGAQEHGAR